MRSSLILRYGTIAVCSTFVAPALFAQNSIRLFDPVNVRASAEGTGSGSSAVTFNSATLNPDLSGWAQSQADLVHLPMDARQEALLEKHLQLDFDF